jgi:Protein of unknown function (DUF3892)
MARHEIRCINKADRYNPHERIQNVGGVRASGTTFKITQPAAISEIERGEQFFVNRGGRTANVVIATHNGNKYLKTEADGVQPDNLLALPECP